MASDSDEWSAALKAMGDTPGRQRCKKALSPADGPVCVTGASGFLALHLIEQLLEKGYTVTGSVRSSADETKMAPLLGFQKKYGEDKLLIADGVDCLKADSFNAAVSKCVGVFHTASPFHFNAQNPMKELVEPAVQGTSACLTACQKACTVKRVVVTSSFAAIANLGKYPFDYKYSSKDWNTVSQPDKDGQFSVPIPQNGYRYSKIAAEKAAWDFAAKEDCNFDVACINPPMIIGTNYNAPKSVADLNTSSATVLKILNGALAPNPNSMGWVDVADVARAHIAAYEHSEAGGHRFLCVTDEVPTWTEVAEILKELYPDLPVVTTPPEGGAGLKFGFDTSELKGLSGFRFTPLQASLKAQGDSLLNQQFCKRRKCEA